MDWAGWALFGLVATTALTAVMIAAQLLGLTRLDLPLLLGTIVTEDPDRARAAGFFIHLLIGQGFAFGYAAAFALLDRATWWLGALLGLLHVAVALTVFVPLLAGVHPRIASDGAIDWMCIPRFDGQPVFGRLVGGPDAGVFTMGPAHPATVVARHYRNETATLETTWDCGEAQLTLTEAMIAEVAGTLLPTTLLVRRLTATGGPIDALVDFDPRLGEHHRRPRVAHRGDALVCTWGGAALALRCRPAQAIEPGQPASISITPDAPLTITLAVAERGPLAYVHPDTGWAALETDERRWRAWCDDIDHALPRRDMAVRSVLTLRLLTYSPSGAPVAAPTTSLPEHRGGSRNWDYRFAWPRDASIGVGAFLGVGKTDEARLFMAWLLHATRLDRPRLPVLLTLHDKRPPAERSLQGWPGYACSHPVRPISTSSTATDGCWTPPGC